MATRLAKRIIAGAMMAVAGFARAETWNWTGEGGNSSWTDPQNWDLKSGYPDGRDDIVNVNASATINLNTGCETKLKKFYVSGSGVVVTLNGTAGSVLNFNYVADKEYVGFTVSKGAKLYVFAELTHGGSDEYKNSGRLDHESFDTGSELHFCGKYTSTLNNSSFMGGNADWFFEGDSSTTVKKNMAFGHRSGNQLAYTVNVFVKDNAVLTDNSVLILGSNSAPPNTVMTQDGENTQVTVSQMQIGGSDNKYYANPTNQYNLKAGSLNVTDTLSIALGMDGKFVQTGGNAVISKIAIANAANLTSSDPAKPYNQDAQGAFEMYGGSTVFKRILVESGARVNCGRMVLKDCTFAADGSYANDVPWATVIGGSVTLGTSGAANELKFSNAVLEPGASIALASAADAVTLGLVADHTLAEGDSIEVHKLIVGNNDAKSDFVLDGGTLAVSELECGDYGTITLAGGTLKFNATSSPTALLKLTGEVQVEVAAGQTVTLNVEKGAGGKFVEIGEGTLVVNYGGKSFFTSGTYDLDKLVVGSVGHAEIVIDGANITAAALEFGSASPASGGKLILKSGSLSIGTRISELARGRAAIELQGGVFSIGGNIACSNDFAIVENPEKPVVTIDVAAGKKFTFQRAPKFVGYPLLTKTGAGGLYFGDRTVTEWRGSISIDGGFVQLGNYATLQHPEGDDSIHQININNDSYFCIGDGQQAAINAWVDFFIYDKRGFIFSYERNTIPVNSITLEDGTVLETPCFYHGTSVKTPADACSDWYRHSEAAECAALVIPYRWTGEGADDDFHNADNWANQEVPPKPVFAEGEKINDARWAFADISKADHISFSADIYITGFVVMSADGAHKQVVLESPSNKIVQYIAPRYGVGSFVGKGNELIFRNCQQKRYQGYPIARTFGGKIIFEGNSTFVVYPMSGNSLWGCDIVTRQVTNTLASSEMAFGGYAGDYSSCWFDAGVDLTAKSFYTGINSTPNMKTVGLRDGAKLTLESLYLNRTGGDDYTTFHLQGDDSELTLSEGLYLGTKKIDGTYWRRAYAGGTFILEAGTLRTAAIKSELMDNYCYFKGGEMFIGAGGISRTFSRQEHPISGDVATVQTTPVVYLQGTTVHATAAFDDSLKTELSGLSVTILDTDEYEVTISGELTGTGTLVKRGSGALVLNGDLNATAKLEIEAGTLKLGANFANMALLRRLTVPSANSVALTAGQTLTVGEFVIDGVMQSGSVACGEGTVVVATSAYDWVQAASVTANYVQTFTAAAEIGSVLYDCLADEPGTLTIAGANGAALTLAAESTIFVAEGDTLVFDLPVVLAGKVYFTGGGNVEFTDKATVAQSIDNTQYSYLLNGTYLSFAAPWSANGTILIQTEASAKRLGRITISGKGYLNQDPFPMNGNAGNSVGIGGELVLRNGGKFRLRNTTGKLGPHANVKQTQRIILEEGGILNLPGKVVNPLANLDSTVEILSYGGVITHESYNVGPALDSNLAVTLMEGNTLELRAYSSSEIPFVFSNDFLGNGKLKNSVNLEVRLLGSLTGVSEVDCQVATIAFEEKSASTLPATADLRQAANTKWTLDFDGIMTINNWYIEGEELPYNRVYTANDPVYGKYLKGNGKLKVTGNPRPGMVIIVR